MGKIVYGSHRCSYYFEAINEQKGFLDHLTEGKWSLFKMVILYVLSYIEVNAIKITEAHLKVVLLPHESQIYIQYQIIKTNTFRDTSTPTGRILFKININTIMITISL